MEDVARKSELRERVELALQALQVAPALKDEAAGKALVAAGLQKLSEVAGRVPPRADQPLREALAAVAGELGDDRLREAAPAAGEGEPAEPGLMERLGLDAEGHVDGVALREAAVRETERVGVLESVFGKAEAETLREVLRGVD
jgi:hypothetical protein